MKSDSSIVDGDASRPLAATGQSLDGQDLNPSAEPEPTRDVAGDVGGRVPIVFPELTPADIDGLRLARSLAMDHAAKAAGTMAFESADNAVAVLGRLLEAYGSRP